MLARIARAIGNIYRSQYKKQGLYLMTPLYGQQLYAYDYQRAQLAVDLLLHRPKTDEILLIKRSDTGQLALPGGFIDIADNECDTLAAERECMEEVGIDVGGLLKRTTFRANPYRDPRGYTCSLVYTASINEELAKQVIAGDDAVGYEWVPVHNIQNNKLAFDHNNIIKEIFRSKQKVG